MLFTCYSWLGPLNDFVIADELCSNSYRDAKGTVVEGSASVFVDHMIAEAGVSVPQWLPAIQLVLAATSMNTLPVTGYFSLLYRVNLQ
jgi:hypothetical protein